MIIYFYQIILGLLPIVLFGFLIALVKRLFVNLLGNTGNKILLATGIVGTPIHELSHAFFCLVFFHKINEIKLYDPSSTDGTLGYVNHSYNKKNIYQVIGNFFIGIAPIIGGTAFCVLLMRFLTPANFFEFNDNVSVLGKSGINEFSISAITSYLNLLFKNILIIFDFNNCKSIGYWIFIVLAISITSHMELSPADIKGSLVGLIFLLVIILILDLIIPNIMNKIILTVFFFSLSYLSLSTIFSLILLLIGCILRIFIRK